jgi:hypothetical protein
MLSLSAITCRPHQQCKEQQMLPNREVSLKIFPRSELELGLLLVHSLQRYLLLDQPVSLSELLLELLLAYPSFYC